MRVLKSRRDYNSWVCNEVLEDYALRFTPHSFRKWSIFRVSNTALGAISFLVLEVIGATLAINYGFENAFWAIVVTSLIIFFTSLPISYYAAKYGLDMDLLTRGAGFGYIGSTISSFIYATFTFILFALEAVIMAYALGIYFDIPLYILYLISAVVIIPLVTHGVTLISKIQMVTQPIWVALMLSPFIFIFIKEPDVVSNLMNFAGESGFDDSFNIYMFATAVGIGMALIPQVGEQVDFLRFMPQKTSRNWFRWHAGVILAGPGWIFIGILKMFAGMLLAYLALSANKSIEEAINPTHMYEVGFSYVFMNPEIIVATTVFFVVLSQIKINITNAYAGSLAWSNFFSRLTHSHPGRVVWLLFNVVIATMLMLLNVSQALEQVLGLYSNIAISWIMAVVADLIINKPLGLSPKGIEFRRAYLYDINPAGVGAMLIASLLSILSFIGVFGVEAQVASTFIAMITALISCPVIAWLTKGKYYLARQPFKFHPSETKEVCSICDREYEIDDVAYCPAYQGSICSLCCSLDVRCGDACKPNARLSEQWKRFITKVLPKSLSASANNGIGHYIFLMSLTFLMLASIFSLIYLNVEMTVTDNVTYVLAELKAGFIKAFLALILLSGIIVWWITLTSRSRQVAQNESNLQTGLLQQEILLHRQTDRELQKSRLIAEQANQAKSRYIRGISHELRTPLNSILGYAQLLESNVSDERKSRHAAEVILRSGDHLLSLIEGTLDIARIESGKLKFDVKSLKLPEYIQHIISMFELQATNKGLNFNYEISPDIPSLVRADQKRLSQILINIIGNAVKYTQVGSINLRFNYAREFLSMEVEDTGPGIKPSELETIFESFVRSSESKGVGGTGLGLTICKLLTELMGGEINVKSKVGIGSVFIVRLFLPSTVMREELSTQALKMPTAYKGTKRKLLVVDNEPLDRELLINILEPLGFEIKEVATGPECLKLYPEFQPEIIFMDLAMPEMDGWETIHLLRNIHKSKVIIGIISANAFDTNLENVSDITEKDFILKPVNILELINWIGERLNLEWISEEEKPPLSLHQGATDLIPPKKILDDLLEMIDMGYLEGARQIISELGQQGPHYADFIDEIQEMSDSFDLEKMKLTIEGKLKNA